MVYEKKQSLLNWLVVALIVLGAASQFIYVNPQPFMVIHNH